MDFRIRFSAQHSSFQSVQRCVCFCGFVSPACPLNDSLHHAPDPRLIHGPFLALEVVNSSISETDTCWPAPLLLFCFLAVRHAEGRRGGGMFEEATRRDVLRAGASHPIKLISQKTIPPSFKAHTSHVCQCFHSNKEPDSYLYNLMKIR